MRTFTFEMLSLLVATAAAACGGSAESDASDGGAASGSSSGARGGQTNTGQTNNGTPQYSDCGPLQNATRPVNDKLCEPQIEATTSYFPGTTCGARVCAWSVVIPCTADAGADSDAGDAGDAGTDREACQAICDKVRPGDVYGGGGGCLGTTTDGGVTYVSCGGCGVGRPPSGFVARDGFAPTAEGAWLSRMAQLEAASVEAFDALHDDLAAHGASDSLLRLVRIAAKDEIRHAALARGEAERRGAIVPDVDVHVARGRSLEELAIENAREGCIEETFGAVLARMQAERATDASLKTMLEGIARDELGHAHLSWRIAAWLDERIDDGARARVREAREAKIAELESALPVEARPAFAAIAHALA